MRAIGEEFAGAEFGDPRRERRLIKFAERMAEKPSASFPSALNVAELEGAYRFFSNPRIQPDKILAPHVERTRMRMGDDAVTLAVHDTSTLSFREEGKRSGFGSLTGKSQQLWTHATLAVRADGSRRPEGLLALSTDTQINHERWLAHVEKANATDSKERLVHVMDREADDYLLFAWFVAQSARFVIRLQYDRCLVADSVDKPEKIREALARAERVVEREVALSPRNGGNRGGKERRVHPVRSGRLARLSISATTVHLQRPTYRAQGSAPRSLELRAVRVWEQDPPAGEPAVEWMLLTSETITTADDALRVVDWYRARWVIEEFFKALKTGCAIEKRQLETFAALSNAVAFFGPMAWQLLLLRHQAQNAPDTDATTALPANLLRILPHIARKPLSATPTAREVFLAIAALGGHLKRNGEPGWQTLARGFEKLRDAAVIWDLALRATRSDQS